MLFFCYLHNLILFCSQYHKNTKGAFFLIFRLISTTEYSRLNFLYILISLTSIYKYRLLKHFTFIIFFTLVIFLYILCSIVHKSVDSRSGIFSINIFIFKHIFAFIEIIFQQYFYPYLWLIFISNIQDILHLIKQWF